MPFPTATDTAETYWDGFYSGLAQPEGWRPGPNVVLVEEVAPLTPGTALDLGCGMGGDAIWLATHGWRVTAVDVSEAALDRARDHARRAGLAQRIRWERHDLTDTLPTGEHDLVCAQFLHSPMERPGQRDAMLRRAMGAVAPGGSFLVIGHLGMPAAMKDTPFDVQLPTAAELRAALGADPAEWRVVTERTVTRLTPDQDGTSAPRQDGVLRLSRAAARR